MEAMQLQLLKEPKLFLLFFSSSSVKIMLGFPLIAWQIHPVIKPAAGKTSYFLDIAQQLALNLRSESISQTAP